MKAKRTSLIEEGVRKIVHEILREGEYVTKTVFREEMERQRDVYETSTQRYLGSLMEKLEDEKQALFEHFIGYTDKIDVHEDQIKVLQGLV